MIIQKSNLTLMSVVIFLVVLFGMGCLSSDHQQPAAGVAEVQCTQWLLSGQNATIDETNISINETQINDVICAQSNSSVILELPDMSMTGAEWSVTASPGLQVTDEGSTIRYFYSNGTPSQAPILNAPSMQMSAHVWNVRMTDTGVQSLQAVLQNPAVGRTTPEEMYNLTVVVK